MPTPPIVARIIEHLELAERRTMFCHGGPTGPLTQLLTNVGYIQKKPVEALLCEEEMCEDYVILYLTTEGEAGLAELREFVSERDATV